MAMASLAAQSGMEAWLVRRHGPEAPPPLAGVTYHRGDAVAALRALNPDPWTAIAVANHDSETDEQALVRR